MSRAASARMLMAAAAALFHWHAVATQPASNTAAQPAAAVPAWAFRVPSNATVPYRGIANFDNAGSGAGGMLYPAPNALGLVAAIITHAVIVDATNTEQKRKIQEGADRVLEPYKPIVESHTRRQLAESAIESIKVSGDKLIVDAGQRPPGMWLVDTNPTFSLVADQSAFVLHNLIAIYPPDSDANPYQADVTVVSLARQGEDHLALWTANSGEQLKRESARLFAQSLEIAIAEATKPRNETTTAVHKTFRYQEGPAEKMQRGELVNAECDRVVIRNLRGGLMSIPQRTPTEALSPECASKGQKD